MVAKASRISEERVLALGIPRTDQYVGKVKGDGGTVLSQKRSYLYLPTFRNRSETSFAKIDWEYLDKEMSDDELLVVKPHPMSGRFLRKQYRHIVEVLPSEPSANYLYDCDVLITDYSSILFDGYLLGKPAVLFEKLHGYTETRGMYFRYPDQYSSRYCSNEKELLRLCRNAYGLTEVEREIIRKVADKCDGKASDRLCELIRREVEEG